MKSTLERELTVREIVGRETLEVRLAIWNSAARCTFQFAGQHQFLGVEKGREKVAISVVL